MSAGVIAAHYADTAAAAAWNSLIMGHAPVIYYRHGEKSGTTMVDSSGHGYDGGQAGTLNVPGLIAGDPDTAMSLNGSNQNALMNTAAALAAMDTGVFTIVGRIKRGRTNTQEALYCRDRNGSRIFTTQISGADNKIRFGVWTTTGYFEAVSATALTSTTTPYTLGFTFTGTKVQIYVNGTLDGEVAATGALNSALTGAWYTIGMTYLTTTSVFYRYTGVVDETTYIGSALTAAQHAALHAAAV